MEGLYWRNKVIPFSQNHLSSVNIFELRKIVEMFESNKKNKYLLVSLFAKSFPQEVKIRIVF